MASTNTPTSAETWCKFLRRSLSMRVDVEQFETYARSILRKAPIPRDDLAAVLISPTAYPTPQLSVDPRYLLYIQRLVSANIVPLSSFLHALWSSDRVQQNHVLHGGEGDMAAALSREAVDTAILTSLVLVVQSLQGGGGGNAAPRETPAALIDSLSKWMDAVIAANDGDGLNALDGHGLDGLGLSSGIMGPQKKAIIGELVIAVGENQTLNGFLKTSHEISKDKRANFENTLPMFVQGFQALNPELAMRLDALIPKKADGPGGAGAGNALLGMGIGLDAIGEGGQPSRGGLYVFINSLLFARPLVDDEYLIHHLLNRYKEIGGQVALDLIIAALDCIANAISRSESESTIALFRHFLVNKIPLLLQRFNMPVIQAQYVVTQALAKSGSNPLSLDPSLDTMLDLSNDIKQEFLFACALHQIIEESSVEVILGDVPLQTMAKRRYTQGELVAECMSDGDRVERLISEIEELDGNSGAIVGAVVEMLRIMCEQRATMGLYTLCKNLISRPKTIDLLLLYSSPATILEPLCIVLENWRYDDDQGEYEPVYKEFGYILLLILTIYYRHDLCFSNLGPSITSTSFVPMFIKQCWKDISVEDLGRMGDRHAQLGGWIKALYEGEGMTDEVMQSCRPQEYYSLVPTLMAQTVEAYERGVLDMRVLKEGLDYFQLPSLIASEVAIIFWLTDYIWQTMSSQGDISNALRILHTLVTNAPSEVTQTHKTILAICSHSLERVLKDVLRSEGTANNPSSAIHQQAEQILKHVSSSRDWRRTGLPSTSELEGWTKHSGGILGALKSAVQGVVMWSSTPDLALQPAGWNPRLLYAAWRLLGAKEVVRVLVDEVVSVGTDVGDVAVDLVANLIVAPVVEDWRWKVGEVTGRKEHTSVGNGGVLTLVEALRYLEDDCKLLGGEEQGRSEVVMKLARKVEGMMVASAVGGVGGAAVVGGVVDLADGVLGDVMVDGDMLMMPDAGVDLGLTADEIMTGM
ncbi:mediator complex subunit [Orbilia oligospora]|uniref:Mediator of RNA polymerase II transcription subunit 5 n=2 Tax=Orbilia oligospora TaxID=2813651 RepID=A0A7C8PG74_ORBOL|nr:mediator complex subunit [Orbilia oligospora]TGJ62791.1 mediator complex subunit [Orbilia oligospora]